MTILDNQVSFLIQRKEKQRRREREKERKREGEKERRRERESFVLGQIYCCVNSVGVTCWTYEPLKNSWLAPLKSCKYNHPGQSGKLLDPNKRKVEKERKREERDGEREKERENKTCFGRFQDYGRGKSRNFINLYCKSYTLDNVNTSYIVPVILYKLEYAFRIIVVILFQLINRSYIKGAIVQEKF